MANWKIKIHEVFAHRGGSGIINSWDVEIAPTSTIKQFKQAFQHLAPNFSFVSFPFSLSETQQKKKKINWRIKL